jgi:hypothetical protein
VAEWFARRFKRVARFHGKPGAKALLNNAAFCHQCLGQPEIALDELLERVAHWIECGGASLNKPTKFEVTDGKF